MPAMCVLDKDNCLPLETISRAFHCGLKEEQTWALIHQSMVALKEDLINDLPFIRSDTLYIKNNGKVHTKTWRSLSSAMHPSVHISTVISSIGTAIYRALDYGADEDEEIIISSSLEKTFERLIGEETEDDEGIDDNDLDLNQRFLDEMVDRCRERVIDSSDIDEHYRNVCRALVAEAIDMSAFLTQISRGTQELKKINHIDTKEVDNIHVEMWAHLWMKVMRQLRVGVALQHINRHPSDTRNQKQYELTPFEMLLDDINSKRYSLKKVINLPKKVEKDARTMILDFVRSRPPLKPAAERVLSPLPAKEPCLHEKLMDGIKHTPVLRQTSRTFERKFDSLHMPRGQRYTDPKTTPNPTTNVFQRFSFRNLSLRTGAINRITVMKTPQSPEIAQVAYDIAQSYASVAKRPSLWQKIYQSLW